MTLFTKLKDFDVVTPLGDKKGKLFDLIVDLSDWKITNLLIKPGLMKKPVSHKLEDIKEIKEDEKRIIIPADIAEDEAPEGSSLGAAFAGRTLMKKEVVSSDGHDIGKVYDFVVPLELKKWKIWKILIKRGMKERRLRLGPEDIDSVSEKVMLKKSLSEIDAEEEKESGKGKKDK